MDKNIGTILGKVTRTIATYLTLLFVTLRACDVIDWPWYCVISPLFVTFGLLLISCLLIGCITATEK